MTVGLYKLYLLELGIPSPGDFDSSKVLRWLVRSRIVDHMKQEGSVFTVFDVMRDDFPPRYYALEEYTPEYLGIIEGLVPEIEVKGWSVRVEVVLNESGKAGSRTRIYVFPA